MTKAVRIENAESSWMKCMDDKKPSWHHPKCQGECLACLIERSVQRDYGTQWLDFLRGHITAAANITTQLNALLQAVEREYPGESRFETALRYIRTVELQAQASSIKPGQAGG